MELFTLVFGGTRSWIARSRHVPPFYKDPGLILLAATVAAATFFAVYVAF
jgi:hypothetical protein